MLTGKSTNSDLARTGNDTAFCDVRGVKGCKELERTRRGGQDT